MSSGGAAAAAGAHCSSVSALVVCCGSWRVVAGVFCIFFSSFRDIQSQSGSVSSSNQSGSEEKFRVAPALAWKKSATEYFVP